ESGAAAAGYGLNTMAAGGPHARTARDPGEAPSLIELDYLPHRRKESWLTDPRPAADSERSAVEAANADHARRPLRPSLDISGHPPNTLGRCGDIDRDLKPSRLRHNAGGPLGPGRLPASNAIQKKARHEHQSANDQH